MSAPIVDAVIYGQTGAVHREIGGHVTSCGEPIPNRFATVSAVQVAAFDLPVCRQCFPDGHGGRVRPPAGGRHRAGRDTR